MVSNATGSTNISGDEMLRDINPVEVSFIGAENDEIVSADIPFTHFTWCFDLMTFGLAPISCLLKKPKDQKEKTSFFGYAMVVGKVREYYPEYEVVRSLIDCGLDTESAKELLAEVNYRNMKRPIAECTGT